MRGEVELKELLAKERPNLWERGLLHLLGILSGGYRAGLFCHQTFYKFKKKERAPLLTISVGNIICGGGGKTPVVALLAKHLVGYRLALVARGYKASLKKGPVMCEGQGPKLTPEEGGDEPFLLAKRFPQTLIYVGKKKITLLNSAAARGAQVALIDDGFQHYGLMRDEDVVVIPADDPFGGGHFLPRGFLRDSPKRLRAATLVVIHNVRDREAFDQLSRQLEAFTRAPIVGTTLDSHCIDHRGNERPLAKKKVAAFCGIARPQSFFSQVERWGGEIKMRLIVPDHAAIDILKLKQFAKDAYDIGCESLICTEKDWVKIDNPDQLQLPLTILRIEARVVYNEHLFENWLAGAKNKGRL
jgi:tetraacyldisaccharide 4'-kinase